MIKSHTFEQINSYPNYRLKPTIKTSKTDASIDNNYQLVELSIETKQSTRRIDKMIINLSQTKIDENYDIIKEIIELYNESKDQLFEDGVETNFSKELISIILKYGNKAVDVLSHLFEYEKVSAESIAESLRWIGKIGHNPSYAYRKWLLERCLFHPVPKIRDAASIGLSILDDPKSFPSVEMAIKKEIIEEIKKDMKSVLMQLKLINQNGISSEKNSKSSLD